MTATHGRVAFVHDWLTGMRGGERVLEELLDVAPQAPIYTLFHFTGSVSEAIEGHPIVTSYLSGAPAARTQYRRYLPLFPRAIERFDMSAFDLLISTSHCVAKGVRPSPSAYHVCYCHTPMRYAWDQETAYFPKRTGPAAWVRGRLLARLRKWDVASASRVDQFVANSEFVAWRIRTYYDRQAIVVHPPVDLDFFVPSVEGREEFALAVSALAPYKRLDLAIEACAASGIELRIVGTGPEQARLGALASGTRTRFLGRVASDELKRLYRTAAVFVQPGVEDFGIATVEAIASGLPVVATGKGGVLDIVEDGVHGVLAKGEPDSARLAASIDKSSQIRFNEGVLRAKAEQFSTARFRERMHQILEKRPSDLKGHRS
jgi:glycosyltransferase involved in cell wall biosynthesis